MITVASSNKRVTCYGLTSKFPDGTPRYEQKFKMAKVPANILDGDAHSLYCLFSPDMKHYLDIDLQREEFVIKETTNPETIVYSIPNDLLPMPRDEAELITQVKFIAWENNNSLRVIDINA